MSRIEIVFHSGYGHTRKVAEAVAAGSGGALLPIDAEGQLPEGGWERLATADAIVFGSPTYMGMVSWQFKKFADASSKPWFQKSWRNKLAAGFTNSASLNGDKASTMAWLMTFAQQHGMFWVGTGMHPANTKHHTRADVNHLGASTGLLTATPSDASVDEMVAGDLETARAFGRRIAEAVSLLRGRSARAQAPVVREPEPAL